MACLSSQKKVVVLCLGLSSYVSYVQVMGAKSTNKTAEKNKIWFCDCHIRSQLGVLFCSQDKQLPTDCAPALSESKIHQTNKGLLRGSYPAATQAFSH